MFTEPREGATGLFCVDWLTNFVHWLAWREWQHAVFEKRFFPQRLTVDFAWPPTSGEGAVHYADGLRATRESLAKERGAMPAAVPRITPPWQEWSGALKRDVAEAETARRAQYDDLFGNSPPYPWSPRMGFRWPELVCKRPIALPTLKPKSPYRPRYTPGIEDPLDTLDLYPGGASPELVAAAERLKARA